MGVKVRGKVGPVLNMPAGFFLFEKRNAFYLTRKKSPIAQSNPYEQSAACMKNTPKTRAADFRHGAPSHGS